MPAKRKHLPKPCPRCKRDYGTIEIVLFGDNYAICRIGHYSPYVYKYFKSKMKSHQSKSIRQKVWCSFSLPMRFGPKFADRIGRELVDEHMPDNYDGIIRIRPPPWFLAYVKRYGWSAEPQRRLLRNIDYWNEQLKNFKGKRRKTT